VAAAVIVAGEGSWAGAAGAADDRGTPLVPQATFAIASVTKSFVAAEVLHLVEEGRMSLDEPLSALLPDGLDIDTNDATLRNTLTMRSGISEHVTDSFIADVVTEPGRHWDPEQNLDYVGASVFPPDTRTQYSNTNYILLGFVIEEQTGLPLGEALRNGVLATEGMGSIVVQDDERPQRPLALPHSSFRGFPSANEAEVVGGGYLPLRSLASAAWSAGSFAADAPTLARWGYLLFGGYVLEPTSLTEMTTFHEGYGMGAGDLGRGAIGHGGEIPGYSSILATRPYDGLVVAALTNGEQLNVGLIADRLAKAEDYPEPLRGSLKTLGYLTCRRSHRIINAAPGRRQSVKGSETPITFAQQLDRRSPHPKTLLRGTDKSIPQRTSSNLRRRPGSRGSAPVGEQAHRR
jgi:D-alanyl-D-alanine carboxypeptidase